MGRQKWLPAVAFILGCACCADPQPAPATDTGNAADVSVHDATVEDAPSVPLDAGTGRDADAREDAADLAINPQTVPELYTSAPLPAPPDVLAGTGVEGCEVYLDETCDGGMLRRCNVYDAASAAFVDPDPLLRRVLLYDRWYDLYHQPQGQTAERTYRGAVPAGTSESEWSSDATFDEYEGLGDAAIWNGSALLSAAMRYAQTGTDADYARMERKTRDLLLQFDVTGIPGYLARFHFLLVAPEAPQRQDLVLEHDASTLDHTRRPIETPATVPGLPQVYLDGFEDEAGMRWTGTPMYLGNPSIDQYVGPRTAFPVVHGLLRDDELKSRIERHLVCYLNRLDRVEIRNLQQNADAIAAIAEYFGGGIESLDLDPGDPDLSKTDTVVFYVLRQINTLNEAEFDRTCPEGPQTEPSQIIDATSEDFQLDALKFALTMNSQAHEKMSGVDHFYVPSVRGADAVHLMHLAALAYHFTGEEQYRRFLFNDLIEDIGAADVAKTASAFIPSRFCRKYFGHHISFTPAWAFLDLLEDQPLRDQIAEVFRTEYWQKEMNDQGNAKFEVFYVGEVEDDANARTHAVEAITALGGNGGVLDDPRRAYTLEPNNLAASLPGDDALACPTVEEIEQCERDITFSGLSLPGPKVTLPCTGNRPECPIGDECIWAQAREPLPVELRRYEDFMWQHNPYRLGAEPPRDGWRQSAGLDLTETFWLARRYGLLDAGAGQALAWQDVGTCP